MVRAAFATDPAKGARLDFESRGLDWHAHRALKRIGDVRADCACNICGQTLPEWTALPGNWEAT